MASPVCKLTHPSGQNCFPTVDKVHQHSQLSFSSQNKLRLKFHKPFVNSIFCRTKILDFKMSLGSWCSNIYMEAHFTCTYTITCWKNSVRGHLSDNKCKLSFTDTKNYTGNGRSISKKTRSNKFVIQEIRFKFHGKQAVYDR